MSDDCLIMIPPTYERRSNRIVAYDLDHTLIRPKNGRVRPRNHQDWELAASVDVLHAEHADNATLVIVTNQSGLKTPASLESFANEKLKKIVDVIGLPMCFIICGGYGTSRKPKTAGWRRFLSLAGFDESKLQVTYVGDAAGRPHDFADTDVRFAINIGATFATPEEYFRLRTAPRHRIPRFNPRNHMHNQPNPDTPSAFFARGQQRDVVLMCGLPGSGKSAWVRKHAPEHYVVISRDKLKTKEKCIRAMQKAFAENKSVVFDNTGLKPTDRQSYAIPSIQAGASAVRVVHMDTTPELAEHLNAMRSEHPRHGKPRVPPCAIRLMKSQYVPPEPDQHISEVYKATFCFDESETDPALFTQYHH